MRGGSAQRPVERDRAMRREAAQRYASGTGSERAKIASVAEAEAPREPGAPVQGRRAHAGILSGIPTAENRLLFPVEG